MSEKPQAYFRANVAPEAKKEAESIWVRFAIAGLQSFTRDIEPSKLDPQDVAGAAAEYADAMLVEWDDRFNARPIIEDAPEPDEENEEEDERSSHRERGRRGRRD